MNLKSYLAQFGIKHKEFATLLGVSNVTVSRWISGDRFPRPADLKRIYLLTSGKVTANDFAEHSKEGAE